MKPASPGPIFDASSDGNVRAEFRRLFYTHVAALVITAIVVVPLLLGVASIPPWVSIAYCLAIAATAVAFMITAVHHLRRNMGGRFSEHAGHLAVIVGLALAQAVFVIPVLICVYAPGLRL